MKILSKLISCVQTTNDIRVESKIPGTEDLCWVVVDVDNITEYDSITIHGVLQFVNDTKVSAIRILVLVSLCLLRTWVIVISNVFFCF